MPFNLKTDERMKSVKSVEREEESETSMFKARAMPNYKFFEVKHSQERDHKIEFKEFKLATSNIRRVRSNSQEDAKPEEESHVFHA